MSAFQRILIYLTVVIIAVIIVQSPGKTVERNLTPDYYFITSRLILFLDIEKLYFEENKKLGTMKELVDSSFCVEDTSIHIYLNATCDDLIIHYDLERVHFFMTSNKKIYRCFRKNLSLSKLEFQRLKRIVTGMERVYEDVVEEESNPF